MYFVSLPKSRLMSTVFKEITPLSDKDCLYIVERHKSEFLFPLHSHREYELNFVENGKGVRRVVGDSVEEIGPYDLTLVAGNELEHAWEQGNCTEADVREITIQFSPDLFPPDTRRGARLLEDVLLSGNFGRSDKRSGGLAARFSDKMNIPFHVADDPLKAVARGTCIALKDTQKYLSFLMR